jgi:hypothetical protein
MNFSPEQLPHFLKRVQKDWEKISGETMDVEYIKGTVYGYGSELAVLRLYHKYKNPAKTRTFFSQNLSTWVFTLD